MNFRIEGSGMREKGFRAQGSIGALVSRVYSRFGEARVRDLGGCGVAGCWICAALLGAIFFSADAVVRLNQAQEDRHALTDDLHS